MYWRSSLFNVLNLERSVAGNKLGQLNLLHSINWIVEHFKEAAVIKHSLDYQTMSLHGEEAFTNYIAYLTIVSDLSHNTLQLL